METKLHRTALSTVLAPIAWGTTYVTVTQLLPSGRPMFVAAMRVVPAGIVLLLIGMFTAPRWRPRGVEWGRTAVLALCNFAVFFPLLIGAVYRLPGGVAAAVGGIQPLLVVLLSWPMTSRRPRLSELVIGAIAVVGVSLVVVRPGAGLDPLGVLMAIGANGSFAVGVVLTKRWPGAPNRISATGWQLVLAGLLLAPIALATEGTPPSITPMNILGFAYLSVVGTALAFLVWFSGIRRLPTAAPPLLGLGSPVTGAVLGWLVLDQSLAWPQLVGFAITIAAIARGATLRHTSSVGVRGDCTAGTLARHEHLLRRAPATGRHVPAVRTRCADVVRGVADTRPARSPVGAGAPS